MWRGVVIVCSQALQRVSQELDYRIDICRVTKGAHIEHLQGGTETWRDSLAIDMLLSAVSVLVVAQSSSEIPEGLNE